MMRTTLLALPILLGAGAACAQSSTWDFHPLNMEPCEGWINPAPGCGGCSSCATAQNSAPASMDGLSVIWSPDLVLCPHPVDTLGNNVVLISGWPLEADPSSYVYGQLLFHEELRIDTLEVIAAKASGGPDSMAIALQFNGTDPSQTTTLLQSALGYQLQTYTLTDLGCVPMWGAGIGWANIHVRAHGGDQAFLFKGLRVVASPCATAAAVLEQNATEVVTLRSEQDGVRITAYQPTDLWIHDALGRVTYHRRAVQGTAFAPLTEGINIVRAGDTVQRIVR